MDDSRNSEIFLSVLPFDNLSDHNGMEVFCKSLLIDLVTELSRFQQFKIVTHVPFQPEVFTDYTIHGSFRYHDEILKINAQLTDNRNSEVAWAGRFDGDKGSLFSIQEEILHQIVSTLQIQLNYDLLIRIRKKLPVNLSAYEHWLYGMEELKKGSLEADEKARTHFQQAIDIDPHYSLAYSGMSLTYFNEWSCQLWERWDVSQRGAFEWAKKAFELNEQNNVAALVLGRVYLYEAAYEIAEHYLRLALELNPNDADNLTQLASCFVFLGYLDEAESIYKKILTLNPAYSRCYNHVGAFIAFEKGEFEKAISLGMISKTSWVDFPALISAAYYAIGDLDNMHRWWETYLKDFQKKIIKGGEADTTKAVQWIIDVNPYRNSTNLLPFLEFIGGSQVALQKRKFVRTTTTEKNCFVKDGEIWRITYDGKVVLIPEVKGFYDIVTLLESPEQQFHCTALMGSVIDMKGEHVFDEKAKRSYKKKILELQEEISWSEGNNDLQRTASLRREYDDVVDHLSSSLGLGGRTRKSNDTLDKTRSAVTWRIRNAIQKIESIHPVLAKHLSVAIKTGILCSYIPEKPVSWITAN